MEEKLNKGNGKSLLKFAGKLKDVDWEEKEKLMKEFRESFNKNLDERLAIVKEINNRISFPIYQGKNFRKFISIDIIDQETKIRISDFKYFKIIP